MTVRIAFLGDTLLGGVAQTTLDAEGYAYALRGISPLLQGADLVVANLEGPITHGDQPQAKLDTGKKRYWYRAQPASATALLDAGIRLVSVLHPVIQRVACDVNKARSPAHGILSIRANSRTYAIDHVDSTRGGTLKVWNTTQYRSVRSRKAAICSGRASGASIS